MLAIATTIATKLMKEYTKLAKSGKLDKDLLPTSVDDVAKGVEALIPGLLNISPTAKVTAELIKRVESAIKKMQGFAQGPAGALLISDGILGEKTLGWLQSIRRCKGELEHTPSTTKVPKPESTNVRKIRYWYAKGGLPDVSGGDPELLLEDAWVSWIKVIQLDVRRAKSKAGANVIVSTIAMDGRSGTLADAHVGPPNGMQFELRFDKAELWDADKFQGTAAHEIGHMLGLRHASGAGQLMSPFFQTGIISPQPNDVNRILAPKLGWQKQIPKPPPTRVAPKPGKPIIPSLF